MALALSLGAAKTALKSLVGPTLLINYHLQKKLEKGEPELRLLPLICDREHDFLDIGANVGVYSYYARRFARKVIAIEANPGLVANLRAILREEDEVLNLAVSDRPGTVTLNIPVRDGREVATRSSLNQAANPGFELRPVEVEAVTVDSLGLRDLGALKIDVEGHEYEALRGARDTLVENRPVVIVECEERHNAGAVGRLFDYFDELGFRPYFLLRGQLRDGAGFSVERFQNAAAAKSYKGERSPDYVNNFLFIHPDRSEALERLRSEYPAR